MSRSRERLDTRLARLHRRYEVWPYVRIASIGTAVIVVLVVGAVMVACS